jgi:hypothetical protein
MILSSSRIRSDFRRVVALSSEKVDLLVEARHIQRGNKSSNGLSLFPSNSGCGIGFLGTILQFGLSKTIRLTITRYSDQSW